MSDRWYIELKTKDGTELRGYEETKGDWPDYEYVVSKFAGRFKVEKHCITHVYAKLNP